MYGRSFEDPDGHIFEPMFMDLEAAMAAFPTAPPMSRPERARTKEARHEA